MNIVSCSLGCTFEKARNANLDTLYAGTLSMCKSDCFFVIVPFSNCLFHGGGLRGKVYLNGKPR